MAHTRKSFIRKSHTALSRTSGVSRGVLLAVALAGCTTSASDVSVRPTSILVAEAALNGGSPRVALQMAQMILVRSPDNVPALLVKGDALTQLGQAADATTVFQQALRLDPNSAHGKLGLGRVRLTTDPTEAAGLFRDVLKVDANNVSALTDLGIALDLLGQHAEAQDYYRRVLHDNQNNEAVQVNLALSLAMTGDSGSALQLIEPLVSAPGAAPKLRHNYAAILAMAGRRAEAADVLKQDLPPDQVREALSAYKESHILASTTSIPVEAAPRLPVAVVQQDTPAAQKLAGAEPVSSSAPLAVAPSPVIVARQEPPAAPKAVVAAPPVVVAQQEPPVLPKAVEAASAASTVAPKAAVGAPPVIVAHQEPPVVPKAVEAASAASTVAPKIAIAAPPVIVAHQEPPVLPKAVEAAPAASTVAPKVVIAAPPVVVAQQEPPVAPKAVEAASAASTVAPKVVIAAPPVIVAQQEPPVAPKAVEVASAASTVAAKVVVATTPAIVARLTPPAASKPAEVAAALPPAVTTQTPMPVVITPFTPSESVVVTQTSAPLPGLPEAAPVFAAPKDIQATPPTPHTVRASSVQPKIMRSRVHVQLGAFDSEAAAKREWQRLKETVPGLLAGRAPTITKVERDNGRVFWRLRTWGFDDRSAANGFCSQLRPTSPRCFVFSA